MFCGNEQLALSELTEVIFSAIKKGWPVGKTGSWHWQSEEEHRLLEKIREKASLVALESLNLFEGYPLAFWAWVPETRASFPAEKISCLALKHIDSFLSQFRCVAEKRKKCIKKELLKELSYLDFTQKRNEYGKKIRVIRQQKRNDARRVSSIAIDYSGSPVCFAEDAQSQQFDGLSV